MASTRGAAPTCRAPWGRRLGTATTRGASAPARRQVGQPRATRRAWPAHRSPRLPCTGGSRRRAARCRSGPPALLRGLRARCRPLPGQKPAPASKPRSPRQRPRPPATRRKATPARSSHPSPPPASSGSAGSARRGTRTRPLRKATSGSLPSSGSKPASASRTRAAAPAGASKAWTHAVGASVRVLRARPRSPACGELGAGSAVCGDSTSTVGSGSRCVACSRSRSSAASAAARGAHRKSPNEATSRTARAGPAGAPSAGKARRYRVEMGASTEPGDEDSEPSPRLIGVLLPFRKARTPA
eukprot:scaffold31815_cov118-Isochrysis_galbana.AAC.12